MIRKNWLEISIFGTFLAKKHCSAAAAVYYALDIVKNLEVVVMIQVKRLS
jgi:hypothetical protein